MSDTAPVEVGVPEGPPPQPIVTGDEYLLLPRDPDTWLIRSILPTGGALIMYGDAKVGKSYAALQLALAVVGATPDWLGFPVEKTGPVVYVQLDTPRSLWATRLEQLKAHGVPIERLHFADRGTLGTWPFDINRPEHVDLLASALGRLTSPQGALRPVAVIIDTLKESHSSNENDATEMQQVIAKLVAATTPAALIIVSHARKPSSETGNDILADQRGSSYIVGRMDAIVRFTKKTVYYIGRSVEEGSIRLRRLENGLWEPDQAETEAALAAVMADASLRTLTAKAKALAVRVGKSEEACRSLLRRAQRT